MFAANISKAVARLPSATLQSIRNISVLSGPPTVRVSPVEKFLHGITFVVGCMAIPTWVLLNVRHYKGAAEE